MKFSLPWWVRPSQVIARKFPKFAMRLRLRAARREWARRPPNEQLVVWMQMLEASPELRAAFRQALRVKGMEEVTAPKPRRVLLPNEIAREMRGGRP